MVIALLCRHAKQGGSGFVILDHAAAIAVEAAQIILSHGMPAAFGRLPVPGGGLTDIGFHARAGIVTPAQMDHGKIIIALGTLVEFLYGGFGKSTTLRASPVRWVGGFTRIPKQHQWQNRQGAAQIFGNSDASLHLNKS